MEELPVVQAAALHQQTLQEAPANVTVISSAEIRKYGYRTLGEALNSIRGSYLTNDRIYHYIGVSGVSLPGDFNTRILVMINGHSMTEHVYDSNNFFGQDFGLDMDLVERIEIIRGSASALYGSNAMLATINIITRSPVDFMGLRVGTETDSFGEKKLSVSDSLYLGRGANLLVSGSVFDNSGQTLFIPQFNSPATSNGVSSGQDGEAGYHTFANLVWSDWNIMAYFNSRRKKAPLNWADNSPFNDRGSRARDSRNFVEAAKSQDVGASGKLKYLFYYDDYRYDDRFDYDMGTGYPEDQRNLVRNDWLGSRVTWSHPFTSRGDVIFGVQGEWEIRNLQAESIVSPTVVPLVRFNIPDRSAALFTQQEWRLSRRWKLDGGLRFDRSHNYGNALSPRIAAVYQQSDTTVFKLVYGRPFRHPSAYEKYYNDDRTLTSNLDLHAESAHTIEFSIERKFAHRFTAIADVYEYNMRDLIQEVYPADAAPQFRNVDSARSRGIEFEFSGKLPGDVELLASAALQRTIDVDNRQSLPNSPHTLAKLRLGMPLARQWLFVASSAEYMSHRDTTGGSQVAGVVIQDLTLTTRRPLIPNFDMQFGIRNLWNRTYEDPVGLTVDTLRQDGRSVFLKLLLHKVQ
jgi:iron complex outermembrane receptor protein